jgi:hypothetical protein
MRDETIIQGFKSLEQRLGQVVQFIQGFQQAIRLDSTSKEIRLLAIQQLLIKKGTITEAEITEQSGLVIQEMQKQAEEEAKKAAEKAAAPTIVPATPEQTAQVTNAPATEEAVKEVVPPAQA